MAFVVFNNTASPISYSVNGQTVTAPANGQVSATLPQALSLSFLASFVTDLAEGNTAVSDGYTTYNGPAALAFLKQFFSPLQFDSDGALLSRVKQAPTGWSYQLRGMETTTGVVGGALVNNDQNNAALTDVTVTCYDASGTVVTDPTNNAAIVKTVLDWEPPYDYYIVSGSAKPLVVPATNVYISVIGVPDYPPSYGGNKVFIQNINFKYLTTEKIDADGRAAKALLYNNPVPHTNKMRFVFYHGAGVQMTCSIWLELYKL